MTNQQLHLAIGIPATLNAIALMLAATLLNSRIGNLRAIFGKRIEDTRDLVRAGIRLVMDKLDSMDTRLTKLETQR